ncbi:KR domain-containing protein, partial [Enterococcus casseliflavus]|uniref:KR domain-containing protein n=1 Tax=Enterococcus casseliflavus TaxID=37734 RepID=UPI003D0C35A2
MFVSFSSLTAALGNEGQFSYTFANSAMDSIVSQRVRDGLCGLSIQFGVIGEVGMSHRLSLEGRTVKLRGVQSVSTALHN